MKIVALDEIHSALDIDAAIEAIADGFRAHSAGRVQLSAVGHLAFPDAHGDCHIKAATIAGSSVLYVSAQWSILGEATARLRLGLSKPAAK